MFPEFGPVKYVLVPSGLTVYKLPDGSEKTILPVLGPVRYVLDPLGLTVYEPVLSMKTILPELGPVK